MKSPIIEATGTTRFLGILVLFLGSIFSLRLFSLQVTRHDEFKAKATTYAIQSVKIPAARGEIFDRNADIPLATNEEAFSVEILPAEIKSAVRDAIFEKTAAILGISVQEIRRKIPEKYYHLYQPITITNAANYATIVKIAEQKDEYPGVYWNSRPKRKYLNVGSLGHLLGYVGEIGRDEYKLRFNQGYSEDDTVGKAGIERQYDVLLKGKDGRLLKTVDVKGKDLTDDKSKVELPQTGKNLILTIDKNIQTIVEKALGPRMGSAIVLKPSTGEILAMVSYPWYDPNIFTSNKAGTEYASLLADPNKPLLNRSIQSSYPPASTFKAVLTTAILEERAFSPTTNVLCQGVIEYGGRDWNCHNKNPGHGLVDLKEALAESCDVYYWIVGRDALGVDNIASYAGDFGYGKLTGIDLPGENSGAVPTPKWKEQSLGERWTPGDTMNISIGQGYLLATPLQVANMIALVVNDGVIYKPYLLKEVRDPDTGAIIQRTAREELSRVSIRSDTFAQVRDHLRGVITQGTARVPLSNKVVSVAGKTGTAEIGLKDRWHSWFVSYGPYDAKPEDQIVVVTMIEATNPWEWWAPYAANIIYQSIFAGQSAEDAAKTLGVSLSGARGRGRLE